MTGKTAVAGDDEPDDEAPKAIFGGAAHGDLNVQNILLPPRSDSYFLLDAGVHNIYRDAAAILASSGGKTREHEDSSLEYVAGVRFELEQLKKSVKWRLFAYRLIRFIVLASSAVTPAIALLSAPPWVTASVAAIAFLLEGAIQLTRLHDRAVLDSQKLTLMGREFRMFRTQVGEYSGNSKERITLLVRRVEEVRQKSDSLVQDVLKESFGDVPGRSATDSSSGSEKSEKQ